MQKRSKVGQSKLKLRGRTAATSKSTAAYADGAPLDRVQYLEAKLILKPDRFQIRGELPRVREDREKSGKTDGARLHQGRP